MLYTKSMLQLNDYIMYGGVGIGRIDSIKSMTIGDTTQDFYILKFKKININLPVNEIANKPNLRKISTTEEINQARLVMEDKSLKCSAKNWNQKYREYTNKINSGKLLEVAHVAACLKNKETLSFAEKKLLEICVDLINEESCFVSNS